MPSTYKKALESSPLKAIVSILLQLFEEIFSAYGSLLN